MRTDSEIRNDVECEMQWDPRVDDQSIGVAVAEGIVMLTGVVADQHARLSAENTARAVAGVRAIANEIQVAHHRPGSPSDRDLASGCARVLNRNIATHGAHITPIICNGFVMLAGEVSWAFQSQAAEHAVRSLSGVLGVRNHIHAMHTINMADLKLRLDAILPHRTSPLQNSTAETVPDSTVLRDGHVGTPEEHVTAADAAWTTPASFTSRTG